MKKLVFGKKLSRDTGARKALFRALIKALAQHGAIVTTKAKAKAIQGKAEKLVTMSKSELIANRRRVYSILGNDRKTSENLQEVAKAFDGVGSGFTRIVLLPRRKGDLAEMARLEWSKEVFKKETKKDVKKKDTKTKTKPPKSLKEKIVKTVKGKKTEKNK